jgi:mannose-6-phosphate isomerase class I
MLKPYIVIPKLIEQPTWGGTYLLTLKGWERNPHVQGHRIGQSYELFGQSKLALTITDSADPRFAPEWGYADRDETVSELFPLTPDDFIPLSQLIQTNPHDVLGEKTISRYGELMPLLIKLNQALGNSFQLHIPYGVKSERWIPKPETWFYFEDGMASMGLKPGCDVALYKEVCIRIEQKMHELSRQVTSGQLPLVAAKAQAQTFVKAQNPWQFVNVIDVKREDVVDPSSGGIHHSWEEDTARYPNGNIVFEIQLDAMDPVATIRSFDQGKMKDDGSVRTMNIEDYFTHLKTDAQSNDIARLHTHPTGQLLCETEFYQLHRRKIHGTQTLATDGSFCFAYCHEGQVQITAGVGSVTIHKGHTAFIPCGVNSYTVASDNPATILVGHVA